MWRESSAGVVDIGRMAHWANVSAGRVLDMAEEKHLNVINSMGASVPARRRASLRILDTASIDTGAKSTRRMSSLEASARAYAAVNAHITAAKGDGRYYELDFDEGRLGFTVALARRRVQGNSPRSATARSWCTSTPVPGGSFARVVREYVSLSSSGA